jgi:Zn-dependent peptidase ImmA (M78 family)
MNDPEAKAKWVLETKGISGIPAESLITIADSEGIRHKYNDYPEDLWDGMLLYKGEKKAILINTHIGNAGKHHFTFAHELGHYFLKHPPNYAKNEQSGFRCTSEDMEKEQRPREAEANRFAAELLMPREQFQLDMVGAPLDFGLINGLSNRYMVSKHVCSNRILQLTCFPCIVVRTKSNQITGWSSSRAAKGFLRKLDILPEGTAAQKVIVNKWGQEDFVGCDAGKWLVRAVPGSKIYECTHIHVKSGTAMTILKW